MSTKNLQTDERIATRRLLGIDAEGREHRWDMVSRTVHVLDGDDVISQEIGDRSLGVWVKYIDTYVGWAGEPNYSDGPFDKVEVRG